MKLMLLFVAAGVALADIPDSEDLQYTINWPSGLSLGEGRLKATRSGETWNFELQFDAAIPGFAVADRFVSAANKKLCSASFDKELQHGRRKTQEKITFEGGAATRQTIGGGKSTLPVPECARDALAFVFFLRRELAQGRLPQAQDVIYGSPYRVKLDFGGTQRVRVGEASEEADKVRALIKGPSSEFTIELFFSKDQTRTPLAAKVIVGMGAFSLELTR